MFPSHVPFELIIFATVATRLSRYVIIILSRHIKIRVSASEVMLYILTLQFKSLGVRHELKERFGSGDKSIELNNQLSTVNLR